MENFHILAFEAVCTELALFGPVVSGKCIGVKGNPLLPENPNICHCIEFPLFVSTPTEAQSRLQGFPEHPLENVLRSYNPEKNY